MDLRHLFIPEPPLTALAISQEAVVLLSLKKTSAGLKKNFIQRQMLPLGAIEKGELRNEKEFIKAVQACFDAVSKKYVKRYPNVIAAIPDDSVYITRLEFPESLDEEEISDAIKVNAPVKFPEPLSETYYDQEALEPLNRGKQEFIFAQVKKTIIDAYVGALKKIGLTVVVLGYANALVMRTFKFPDNEAIIVIRECSGGYMMTCVIKKQIRNIACVRHSPNAKAAKTEILTKALEKYSYYIETELGSLPKTAVYLGENLAISARLSAGIEKELKLKGFDIKFAPMKNYIKSEILNLEKQENLAALLPAYGLGLRSLVSRDQDIMISLLPVGTEEAYETKKTAIYARTLANIIAAMAIIMVLVFGASYLFLKMGVSDQLRAGGGLSSNNLLKGSQDLEKQARYVNSLLETIDRSAALKNAVSPVISVLKKSIVPGVLINSIQITDINSPFTVNGAAITRDQAIAFKESLEKSESFSEIQMPFSSLKSEQNVNFQITMKYQP